MFLGVEKCRQQRTWDIKCNRNCLLQYVRFNLILYMLLKLYKLHRSTALQRRNNNFCNNRVSNLSRMLLPPANEVCEGYVFTRVCHSVHRGEGWSGPGRGCLLWGVPGPGGACSGGGRVWSQGEVTCSGGCLVETPPDGYCCGRYASYWNAFLL